MATLAKLKASRDERKLAKELVERYEILKNDRSGWEALWQELVSYFVPNKADIPTKTSRTRGAKKTEKLFDSTSLDCVARLTAAMQGNLTPTPVKWFYLKMRLTELNQISEVRDWLEECANRMRLALNNSNFSSEMNELYQDIIVFGTAFMLEEEKAKVAGKFGGLRFKTFGVGSYCVDENEEGLVDTVFREFKLSARNAKAKWPDAYTKSLKLKTAIDTNKGHTRFDFLHAIYKRDDGEWDEEKVDAQGNAVPRPAMRMPYASVYVCLADRTIMSDGGFPEFPAMSPRWSKASDDVYGRGPGHLALPDVKTLNRAKELGLKAWAKEIDPMMMMTEENVVGDKNFTPGGTTVVVDMNGLAPIKLDIKHDVSKWNLDMLISQIRSVFYVDQLVLKESPQMTAEEVRARMELMQRILGPTFGRLEFELLNRLIERTFSIMLRSGALPEVPQAVRAAYQNSEGDIDIEYEGPLARAQRNSERESIEKSLTRRLLLFKDGIEDAFDGINIDLALEHADKIDGVPETVLNDEEKREVIKTARAEQQRAELDAAKNAAAAKTAKDAASASETMGRVPDEDAAMMGGQIPEAAA